MSDTASEISMLSADGEVQDDPMTAARNMTRAALGLPTITNDADAAVQTAMLSGETAGATPTTGIDTDCVDAKAIGRLFATDDMRSDLDAAEDRFYESLMPRQNQQN